MTHRRSISSTAVALIVCIGAARVAHAQTRDASPDAVRTTGGLSLGLSGLRSADGTTVRGDLMWVGDEMNDGPGVRVLRQGLAPRSHGYAAMVFVGGPPRDSLPWLRVDFGFGYVGQQAARSLKFHQRHGVGVEFATTIAPLRFGIVKPELNAWAIVGTSAQFLGASLGVRVLDPRNR
jgi:hypothetical protein